MATGVEEVKMAKFEVEWRLNGGREKVKLKAWDFDRGRTCATSTNKPQDFRVDGETCG